MSRHVKALSEAELLFVILADQLSALRAELASEDMFNGLADCSETLLTLATGLAPADAEPAALAERLNRIAFRQAQRLDMACQIADCVIGALQAIAQHAHGFDAGFSLQKLETLYVSNGQRDIHKAALLRLLGANETKL